MDNPSVHPDLVVAVDALEARVDQMRPVFEHKHQSVSAFDALPTERLEDIIQLLSPGELLALQGTKHAYFESPYIEYMWRLLIKRDFRDALTQQPLALVKMVEEHQPIAYGDNMYYWRNAYLWLAVTVRTFLRLAVPQIHRLDSGESRDTLVERWQAGRSTAPSLSEAINRVRRALFPELPNTANFTPHYDVDDLYLFNTARVLAHDAPTSENVFKDGNRWDTTLVDTHHWRDIVSNGLALSIHDGAPSHIWGDLFDRQSGRPRVMLLQGSTTMDVTNEPPWNMTTPREIDWESNSVVSFPALLAEQFDNGQRIDAVLFPSDPVDLSDIATYVNRLEEAIVQARQRLVARGTLASRDRLVHYDREFVDDFHDRTLDFVLVDWRGNATDVVMRTRTVEAVLGFWRRSMDDPSVLYTAFSFVRYRTIDYINFDALVKIVRLNGDVPGRDDGNAMRFHLRSVMQREARQTTDITLSRIGEGIVRLRGATKQLEAQRDAFDQLGLPVPQRDSVRTLVDDAIGKIGRARLRAELHRANADLDTLDQLWAPIHLTLSFPRLGRIYLQDPPRIERRRPAVRAARTEDGDDEEVQSRTLPRAMVIVGSPVAYDPDPGLVV